MQEADGIPRPGSRFPGRFLSLQARITLSVGAAIAVILAAFGYIADWAIHESTSTVLQDRLQVAEIIAGQIAETLTGYRHELEDLTWVLSQAPDPRQQAAILQQASAARRFAALAIVAQGGRVLLSHPAEWLSEAGSPLHSMLLAKPLRNAASLPPLAAFPGARLAAFVVPIKGSDRFLVGAVDLAQARLAGTVHGSDGVLLDFEVIDSGGMVLASSGQAGVGQPTEHLPVVATLVRHARPGIVFHNVPRYPHYVAYAPLPGYPGWAVNVEQPRDLVLSLPHGLQRRMVLLGLVVMAGMSLLAFLDVRSVVLPLTRLRDAAERIAGGDLDHPVQVARRDEVGTLARTFEAMRATLKTSREEIAAWNRELEDRVAERTRELSAMAAENARLFALARQEERNLASTVDLLSDGLLTLDLNRHILSLNPAAEHLLGWTSDEATGLHCTELLACPGCLAGHTEAPCVLQAALEPGGAVRGVRIEARRRGGGTFPALLTSGLGRDEQGHPTHFIVTISDRTTEEAYERQLQGRIRQLTTLHEIAQALSLLPLRTVEETSREVVQRIAAATGGRCRLDLYPRGDPDPGAAVPPLSFSAGQEEALADHGGRAGALVSEPLTLQARRIGTLWLDPGPTVLTEADPTLIRIIASQVAVAVENAELYEDVRDRDALRRQLLDRIVVAQEDERHRIARELHDEIGQGLTALVMQLGATEAGLPAEASPLREQLTRIRALTSQTVGEVRRLMLNLRPAVLDDLGLLPAIRWYVESHLSTAGIEARVSVSGLDEHQRLPRRLELVAFRVTQEAVTNILRHAGATTVTITIARQDGTLVLSIHDDGRGFDAEARRRPGRRGGWGLVGMQERVALLGGTLTVTSQPQRGTRVTAAIPIAEGSDEG